MMSFAPRLWARLIAAIVARDADLAEATHRRMATENMVAGLSELARREQARRAPARLAAKSSSYPPRTKKDAMGMPRIIR